MLVRDYKGKNADRLVTWIDTGVVSLVAELRGHERQTGHPAAHCGARGGGHARQ